MHYAEHIAKRVMIMSGPFENVSGVILAWDSKRKRFLVRVDEKGFPGAMVFIAKKHLREVIEIYDVELIPLK